MGLAQSPVKTNLLTTEAPSSESYRSFTFNGAWCWFSDPRAVYHEGEHRRTYSGWIDNFGDLHVAWYDHDTEEIHSRVLFDSLEVDDHDNPSLHFDAAGRLMVFFNRHMMGVQPLYLVRATEPEAIDDWAEVQELSLNDPRLKDLGDLNHTYTNPIQLAAEDNRLYLFWRGVDGKPSYSVSDDNGVSWSTGRIFFQPERIYGFRRPYTKVYSDGQARIHFVVTDGHPRKEPENSLYYFYYEGGAFYQADGSKIKDLGGDAITPAEADKLYDAAATGHKAWNWDIAQDQDGHPVIAYATFPDDSTHLYCYARWDGKRWKNYELVNSGGWFPQTMAGVEEPEPNYSGGMSLDHESPEVLYLSVKRDSVFEIERWETPDGGKRWEVTTLTRGSRKDNVRPVAVRGAKPGNPLQVLWMQNTVYHHFAYASWLKDRMKGQWRDRYHSAIQMSIPSPRLTDALDPAQIVPLMRQVADWQLENPRRSIDPRDWHYGAFYTGLMALYQLTGENRYRNELYNVGQQANWQPMDDIFHADRITIMDVWADLYAEQPEAAILNKSRWAMDIHLASPIAEATDMRYQDNKGRFFWWTWCDALYMAPPSFAKMSQVTGDPRYLAFADEQWWKVSDYLYSPADSLYFRDDRYFDKRTENGKKVFWARGNGWVIAGLARLLTVLPTDYPNRAKFEQQYQEMAHKLLSIQDEDGLWRVSLLDPEYLDQGESSGSAFYTFALAWGLNQGLLDSAYRPQVEKAWQALCAHVNQEGRLGYVQQVAGDPYPFFADQSHVYASGAFLLTGREMLRLAGK
jgi:rhamnogalacturonyl hydrolase YesR